MGLAGAQALRGLMPAVFALYTPIDTASPDDRAVLLFVDNKLVACIVHLVDERHGELFGNWYVEAVFADDYRPTPLVYTTLDQAIAAITTKVVGEPLAISGPIRDLLLPGQRPSLSVVLGGVERAGGEQGLAEDEADQVGLAKVVDQRGDRQQDRH